jgi:hypothetical protein
MNIKCSAWIVKTIFRPLPKAAAKIEPVFSRTSPTTGALSYFSVTTLVCVLYGIFLLPFFYVRYAVIREGATMSGPNPNPSCPSLPWRFTSSLIMGLTGSLSRAFYYGLNNVEVVGLEGFMQTLDRRKDIEGREKGLITGIWDH